MPVRILVNREAYNVSKTLYGNDKSKRERFFCSYFLKLITDYQYYSIKNDSNKVFRMSLHHFAKIVGNTQMANKIIRDLLNNNYIKKLGGYKAGKYSQGYVTTFVLDDYFLWIYSNDYLTKTVDINFCNRLKNMLADSEGAWLMENARNMFSVDLYKIAKVIRKYFDVKLPIDEQSIENFCLDGDITNNPLNISKHKLLRIKRDILTAMHPDDWHSSTGSKSNRIFTPIHNIKKEVRRCLISKDPNNPLVIEMDISNSQIIILLSEIIHRNLKIEKGLANSILNGTFYNIFGLTQGYEYDDADDEIIRDRIKKIVFSKLLFCKNQAQRENGKEYKAFKKRFPIFCNSIKKICYDIEYGKGATFGRRCTPKPSKNYPRAFCIHTDNINIERVKELKKTFTLNNKTKARKTLACHLQNIESSIILNIAKKYNCFSIHDSVIFNTSHPNNLIINNIYNDILKAFQSYGGILPNIKTKYIDGTELKCDVVKPIFVKHRFNLSNLLVDGNDYKV